MAHTSNTLSRRDFLKLAGLGLGTLALDPFRRVLPLLEFPAAERLGRVLEPVIVRAEPKINASPITRLYEDTIVEWHREVAVSRREYMDFARINQRWVETPLGYIFAPSLQPVRNLPNTPLAAIPHDKPGFWAEVTVPYVDLILDNPPARAPWLKDTLLYGLTPRLYYSQVVWIDRVRLGDSGLIYYRFNEDYGHGYGYGDIFWAEGAAFHPLTEEDVAPISLHVDPTAKRIRVNITNQTLSCFEGEEEVYFCRISSGYESEKYATPRGNLHTHWKIISKAMGGGTSGAGFDTPAVSWPVYISGEGVAIHAAFWHNDFGTPRSHGCINVSPEDAKWIFRWTTPYISLETSEVRMTWPDHGTVVTVIERTY